MDCGSAEFEIGPAAGQFRHNDFHRLRCGGVTNPGGNTVDNSGPIGSFLFGSAIQNSADLQMSTMVSDGKEVVPMATPGELSGSGDSAFSVVWDSTGL